MRGFLKVTLWSVPHWATPCAMAKRGSEHVRGAGLYMCQYMLIIPTLTDVLRRIGVSTGLVGAIAGASDFASMFMTPGAPLLPTLLLPALGLCPKLTSWLGISRFTVQHNLLTTTFA